MGLSEAVLVVQSYYLIISVILSVEGSSGKAFSPGRMSVAGLKNLYENSVI